MDDVKQGYRDTKNDVKEQARKIDGDSPADVLGNIGDDVKRHDRQRHRRRRCGAR